MKTPFLHLRLARCLLIAYACMGCIARCFGAPPDESEREEHNFDGLTIAVPAEPRLQAEAKNFKDSGKSDALDVESFRLWVVSKKLLPGDIQPRPLLMVSATLYREPSWAKAGAFSARQFIDKVLLPGIALKHPVTSYIRDIPAMDELVRSMSISKQVGEKNVEFVEIVMDGEGGMGRFREMMIVVLNGRKCYDLKMLNYKNNDDIKTFVSMCGSAHLAK